MSHTYIWPFAFEVFDQSIRSLLGYESLHNVVVMPSKGPGNVKFLLSTEMLKLGHESRSVVVQVFSFYFQQDNDTDQQ